MLTDDDLDETLTQLGGSQVTWLDTPPLVDEHTLVLVTEALLPLAVCSDVTVKRAVEEKLSVVEQFMIEVALEIGDVTVEDIDELITLPAEATERIAAELCERGVLAREGGGFRVHEETARAVLDREVLVTYRHATLTFIVLPRSGDVLAFESKRGPTRPLVEQLTPAFRAPVPEPIRSTPVDELLRARIEDRRVAGLPDDVVDVVPIRKDDPWRDECPVYRCTGRVWQRGGSTGEIRARADVYGERGDKRYPIDLSEASGVVADWLDDAEILTTPQISQLAWEAIGLDTEGWDIGRAEAKIHRRGSIDWVFVLDADEAQMLSVTRRSLSQGGGLEITSPDATTRTAVTVHFSPRDRDAMELFAIEDAVDRVIERGENVSARDVHEARTAAAQAFGLDEPIVSAEDVRKRLWQRGRQDVVYRLRASEDFDYG